ncbi:GTP-binding protein [Paenibacillus filicis]|uniref:GTP-binding protein n=1 Tax=Paenibacillus gyeongsangnamensis TaxID=3388067 RepID=A0ABT4QGH2_9BACL|nr:GTP-binding protein [Paenibacillus filicis]MCZ8515954.1 GTP-binding protein [Paenibacillus filicis]
MKSAVPVHILSGFLGSGKTTLLTRALDYYKAKDERPAVLMNELGDVNLDGMLVGDEVPMTEMLSGCICCTIRGDLGMELKELVDEHRPDVIFVECTGAANPIEILDGVTDASLLTLLELRSVITVVDAAHLLERASNPKGKTYRLMKDQIRCATVILLNKSDLVKPEELEGLERSIRELNAVAPIHVTVRCEIDYTMFDRLDATGSAPAAAPAIRACGCGESASSHAADCDHSHAHADHSAEGGEHDHGHEHAHEDAAMHHSHEHVMVHTHYFQGPIDSERFEELIGRLPREVYRAKGILRFKDTGASTFMFQYAYREADFMKINPQADVPNVAVFIGEHFDKHMLASSLQELEREPS